MKLPTLPTMRCDQGCGACCGPTTVNDREMASIRRYMAEHNVIPKRQGVTCPMYQNGSCAIYPVRPFICQIFGHSQSLVCCRGYNNDVTPKEERRLRNRYTAEGELNHWIHELCFTHEEMAAILSGSLE